MKELTTEQKEIQELLDKGVSIREASRIVFERDSKESTIRGWINQGILSREPVTLPKVEQQLPKILFYDIETAPNLLAGWSLWNQNFGLNQVVNEWFLLSYAAKWLGSDEVLYEDMRGIVHTEDDTHLLDSLWKLLDEADIVIGQNSKAFDTKKLQARWIMNGYKPPRPYKQIDTLDIAKRNFAFTSRKLEWMSDKLCTNKKLTHQKFAGFELWKQCMLDNPEAWAEMEDYNKMDVVSLEELYLKLAAWDNRHVNLNLYTDKDEHVCRCGSHSVVEDGFAYTSLSKFQQYRCLDCGATTRGRINLFSKEKRQSLHMNVINS